VCPALIVLDLDGTLLRSDRTISERTIAALQACDHAGIQLMIASTRGAAAIKLVAPTILTNALWIAHNGTLITRASTVLHSFPLPHDALTAIIELARPGTHPARELLHSLVNANRNPASRGTPKRHNNIRGHND